MNSYLTLLRHETQHEVQAILTQRQKTPLPQLVAAGATISAAELELTPRTLAGALIARLKAKQGTLGKHRFTAGDVTALSLQQAGPAVLQAMQEQARHGDGKVAREIRATVLERGPASLTLVLRGVPRAVEDAMRTDPASMTWRMDTTVNVAAKRRMAAAVRAVMSQAWLGPAWVAQLLRATALDPHAPPSTSPPAVHKLAAHDVIAGPGSAPAWTTHIREPTARAWLEQLPPACVQTLARAHTVLWNELRARATSAEAVYLQSTLPQLVLVAAMQHAAAEHAASSVAAMPSACAAVLDDAVDAAVRVELLAEQYNVSQQLAIVSALLAKLALVIGPPGAGKTLTAAAIMETWLQRARDRRDLAQVRAREAATAGSARAVPAVPSRPRVLAAAPSNVAVDALTEGLCALGLPVARVGETTRVSAAAAEATVAMRARFTPEWQQVEAAIEQAQGLQRSLLARERHKKAQAKQKAAGKQQLKNALKPGKASAAPGDLFPAMPAAKLRDNARAAWRRAARAEMQAAQRVLNQAELVAATCTGAEFRWPADTAPDNRVQGDTLHLGQFDMILIDEAGQAIEPELLCAMARAAGPHASYVLIGDDKQLAPTVLSKAAAALASSLFERWVSDPAHSAAWPLLPATSMLTTQYRSAPQIAEWPAKQFYRGLLRSASSTRALQPPPGLPWTVPKHGRHALPVLCVAAPGAGEQRDGAGSVSNDVEAHAAVQAVQALLRAGCTRGSIGVIAPYTAQVRAIADLLRSQGLPVCESAGASAAASVTRVETADGQDPEADVAAAAVAAQRQRGLGQRATPLKRAGDVAMQRAQAAEGEIEVRTVDGFQGREKDVVILSATRSNAQRSVGFLNDARRLNVAMTRARRGLVVLCDPRTLWASKHWRSWLRWAKARDAVVSPRAVGGLSTWPGAAAGWSALRSVWTHQSTRRRGKALARQHARNKRAASRARGNDFPNTQIHSK